MKKTLSIAAAISAALLPVAIPITNTHAGEDLRQVIAPSYRPYTGPSTRHRTKKGPGRRVGSPKRRISTKHTLMYSGRGFYAVRNKRKLLGTRG